MLCVLRQLPPHYQPTSVTLVPLSSHILGGAPSFLYNQSSSPIMRQNPPSIVHWTGGSTSWRRGLIVHVMRSFLPTAAKSHVHARLMYFINAWSSLRRLPDYNGILCPHIHLQSSPTPLSATSPPLQVNQLDKRQATHSVIRPVPSHEPPGNYSIVAQLARSCSRPR